MNPNPAGDQKNNERQRGSVLWSLAAAPAVLLGAAVFPAIALGSLVLGAWLVLASLPGFFDDDA